VPALGYFVASGAESQAVAALRERILAHYGADVLVDRRAWAMDRLSRVASLDPAAWPAPPPEGRYDDPPFAYPWARSYLDAAGGVGAVEVLEAAAPLDDSALVVLGGPGGQLEDSEMLRLRASREELEAGLVRLVGSMRPDWGRPFLVGLARLLALDEALVRGRLVVLAVLPEDGRRLEHRVLAERQALLEEMIAVGREQVELARRAWLEGAATDELQQARLEETINRVDELERAMRERRDLRLAHGQLLPSRPGRTRTHLPRIEAPSRIDAHVERVAARQKRHRAGMKELYRYHLTARNCVSELFLTLNDGLGGSKASSELALGGYVDGRRDLTFVPFVSAQAVGREYRVIDQRVVPSHRELRLAEMRREESALRVALRESNTLTARSYRRAHRDSYFLLFTDDSVLPRPIFGAVNLAAAGLESVWGLARLPLDGGHTLVSGLEGALLSLPELAFFNIRKGSNDWVAPRPPLLDD
jgi:hypothetical protein